MVIKKPGKVFNFLKDSPLGILFCIFLFFFEVAHLFAQDSTAVYGKPSPDNLPFKVYYSAVEKTNTLIPQSQLKKYINAKGQIVLTLKQARALAQQHNLQITKAEKLHSAISRQLNSVINLFYPQVRLTGNIARANHVSSFSKELNQLLPEPLHMPTEEVTEKQRWSFTGSVDVLFSFSARQVFGVLLDDLQYKSSVINLMQVQQQVRASTDLVYAQILFDQDSLKNEEAVVHNDYLVYQQAKKLYHLGRQSKLSYLTAMVQYENEMPQLHNIKSNLANDRLYLKTILGLPMNMPVFVQGDLRGFYNSYIGLTPKQKIDASLICQNYLLSSLKLQADIYNKQYSFDSQLSQLQSYFPSASIDFSYSPSIGLFDNWGDGNNWTDQGRLSFNLSLPLDIVLPFSYSQVGIMSARDALSADDDQFQYDLDDLKRQVLKSVDQINVNLRQYQSSQVAVMQATQAYSMSMKAYQSGVQTLVDLTNTQSQLNSANLNYLNQLLSIINNVNQLSLKLNVDIADILKIGVKKQ